MLVGQFSITQILPALRPLMFSCSILGAVVLKFASEIFRFRGRGRCGLSFYHPGSISAVSTFAWVGYSIFWNHHEEAGLPVNPAKSECFFSTDPTKLCNNLSSLWMEPFFHLTLPPSSLAWPLLQPTFSEDPHVWCSRMDRWLCPLSFGCQRCRWPSGLQKMLILSWVPCTSTWPGMVSLPSENIPLSIGPFPNWLPIGFCPPFHGPFLGFFNQSPGIFGTSPAPSPV